MGVVAVSCSVTGGGDDADEVVKKLIFHTTSKKVLRSSEKQKPRAYVPHTPYVKNESFVRGYDLLNKFIEYSN